jgi:DNA-binding transcriptional MerR regulator
MAKKSASTSERPPLLASHVARALVLSEHTVRRYANNGTLPCTRDAAGRRLFDPDDIERFRRSRAG